VDVARNWEGLARQKGENVQTNVKSACRWGRVHSIAPFGNEWGRVIKLVSVVGSYRIILPNQRKLECGSSRYLIEGHQV